MSSSGHIRRRILDLVERRHRRAMKWAWDEDIYDQLSIPWQEFMEQLNLLQHQGLVSIKVFDREKYGKFVQITDLGRERLEQAGDPHLQD